MEQMKKLFLLLCLTLAGAQGAWATVWTQNHAKVVTVHIGRVTYECVHIYQTYKYSSGEETLNPYYSEQYYASVIAIDGDTMGDVVIAETITNGGKNYPVNYIGWHTYEECNADTDWDWEWHRTEVDISNYYVSKLTVQGGVIFKSAFSLNSCTRVEFQNFVTFEANVSFPSVTEFVFNGYTTIKKSVTLSCNNINVLKFNGITHEGKIQCSSLRNIYYQSNLPAYSGLFSNYFTGVQGSQVTAHVYDRTEQQMAAFPTTAVWCDFKEIINHTKTGHDVTLYSSGGGLIEIWKYQGSSSKLEYTKTSSSSETITLYDDADNYQIRIYYKSGQEEKPILERNGTRVSTIESSNGNYCYYTETNPMNVNSYNVNYSNLRWFKLFNFGNGDVKLTGKVNGEVKTRTAVGVTEASYGFDNTQAVKVEITPDEGYKVRRTLLWGYLPMPFTVDETTGVATQYYSFADDGEHEETLKIYYQKATIPEGTPYNVHLSVEGAEGSCYAIFGDGDTSWLDDDIEDNDIPWQVDPGETYDLIGKYETGQYVEFWAITDFGGVQEAGTVNSVKVYVNGALVEDFEPTEEWGDHYTIPLDGGDMNIRIVFESNARYLSGNNGEGGTLAIFKEGSSEALVIYPSNRSIWHELPKSETYYAVITPNAGRAVSAFLRNGTLLLSLETYRQSDGTYRIPLENFGNGDSLYELTISYGAGEIAPWINHVHEGGSGSLGSLVEKLPGAQRRAISKLMVSGEVGGLDLRAIRYLAGADDSYDKPATDGNLHYLDLTNALLVNDRWFYTNSNGTSSYSQYRTIARDFLTDTKLDTLLLPKDLNGIESQAFSGAKSTLVVMVPWKTPLTLNEVTFGSEVSGMTLIVPLGSIDAYQNDANWQKFGTIYEGTSGEGEDEGTALTVTTMEILERVYLIDKDGNETVCFESGNVIDWPEGEPLTVEASRLLGNSDYEALLIVDGTVIPLQYDAEKNRFTGYELLEVNKSHSIVLQLKRVKNSFVVYVGPENSVALQEIDEEGNVIMNGGGCTESLGLGIASTSGLRITFTPADGKVITGLSMDGCTIPLDNENLSQTASGDYVYIIPARTSSLGDHLVCASFSPLEGDMNHDGEINIADVTNLVNEVLEKAPTQP